MATVLNPYLNFRDQTKPAMEFYKIVFGGQLDMQTFQESHMSENPAENDRIMHAMLATDSGMTLMAADLPDRMPYTPGNNTFSISLSGDNEPELRGYYEKLAEDGAETMHLDKAPWGDIFGMVTDKFGISWLVNINASKIEAK
jgi:PhnB protein